MQAGAFASGYDHYARHGKTEGRIGSGFIKHAGPIVQSEQAFEKTVAMVTAAQESAARYNVASAIHESDHLLAFILRNSPRSAGEGVRGAIDEYFAHGHADAERIKATIQRLGLNPGHRILDFAAGFGRVSRHLTDLNLTASDIHAQAIAFLERDIGVKTFPSAIDPELIRAPPEPFDFIFVISLFSHLPDKLFGPWLRRLIGLLAPGGFLFFTTHGAAAGERTQVLGDALDPATGFGYLPISDQADLSPDIYGATIVTDAYVFDRVRRFTNARLHSFSRAAWWNLQDEWIVQSPGRLDTSPA